uniref:CUB domain-containing protein n=1 Tax=Biomphalaria glabrata TaxID=6526 RepID=A0A2C9KEW1_BIOGL
MDGPLRVRDGNKNAAILSELCDERGDYRIVQSTSQWLWLLLKTDNYTEGHTKLYAEFRAFTDANLTVLLDSKKKPAERECRSYEFECRNKECISMSYRCDRVNDCGCTVDCDESGCEGINLSKMNQFIVGFSIGCFVFMSVCFMTCLIEGQSNWIASRVEELRMRENQAGGTEKESFQGFHQIYRRERSLTMSQTKALL